MIQGILKRQLELISPNISEIEAETNKIIRLVEKQIKKENKKIKLFVGGSLAKHTLIKKQYYDVDIFLVFQKEEENMSETTEKILKKCFTKPERIHGSRDYFLYKHGNVYFEFIPILKVSNPNQAKNITDLSPSHVFYVRKKLAKNPRLAKEIMLAKSFLHACGTYGAESYISGFSGYAVECLIIHYQSFMKFIKEIAKAKNKIILDPEKHYKNKGEILVNLNESKLNSPIILVDPVFKERNVLASLNSETLEKLKHHSKKFISKPSIKLFSRQKLDLEKIKKEAKAKKAELLIIEAKAKNQKYDVAGAKLKKFHNFLARGIEKNFRLINKHFDFNEEKLSAKNIFMIKKLNANIMRGPPVEKKESVAGFKKAHKHTFMKQNIIYARETVPDSKSFLKKFKSENKKIAKDMKIAL